MNTNETIRAWKDPRFRASLKNAPANPAGRTLVEADEQQLQNASGGMYSNPWGWFYSVSAECSGYVCSVPSF